MKENGHSFNIQHLKMSKISRHLIRLASGVPVSTETLNLLLKARLTESPRAVRDHHGQILTDIKRHNLEPDAFTYGLLMKGAASRADPEYAFELVELMAEQQFKLNPTILTSLIWACRCLLN